MTDKITVQFSVGVTSQFNSDGNLFVEWLNSKRPIHCVTDSKGKQYFLKNQIAYVRIEPLSGVKDSTT